MTTPDPETLAARIEQLGQLAFELHSRGDDETAVEHLRQALALQEELDPGEPAIIEIVRIIRNLYGDLGKPREALPFGRRLLALRRASTPIDEDALLDELHNLALHEERVGNLAEAASLYREVISTSERVRGTRAKSTAIYITDYADLLRQTGDLDEAEQLLAAAMAIHRETGNGDDAPIATTMSVLGLIHLARGHAVSARPLLREALRIKERELPETDIGLATAYSNWAVLSATLGDFAEAESAHLHAEQLIARAFPGVGHVLIAVEVNLADLYRQMGRLADAETYAASAVAKAVAAFGEEHPQTVMAMNQLGNLYVARNRFSEAIPLFERLLQVQRTLNPGSPLEQIAILNNLGTAHQSRGAYGDAIRALTEASEMAGGADHPIAAFALDNLSVVHRLDGDPEMALAMAERALEFRQRIQGAQHPDVAFSMKNVAGALMDLKRYAVAELLLVRSRELARETAGTDAPIYASVLNDLGVLYKETKRLEEAEKTYAEALEIARRALGPRHAEVATTLGNISLVRHEQDDLAGAISFARAALEIDEEALGKDHPKVAASLHNLASLLLEQDEFFEARACAARALEITRTALRPGHPQVAALLDNQADLQRAFGDYRTAASLLEEVLELEKGAYGDHALRVAVTLVDLADTYREGGRLREAAECVGRAIEIRRRHGSTETFRFADALESEGLICSAQGRFDLARDRLLRALKLKARLLGKEHGGYVRTVANLAMVYTETGHYAKAARLHLQAKKVVQRVGFTDSLHVSILTSNLALLRVLQGFYREAEELLLSVRDLIREKIGAAGPRFAANLANLAVVYDETGAYAKAREHLEQALAIERRTLGDAHPRIALTLNSLAAAHLRVDDTAGAVPLLMEALEMRRLLLGEGHPDVARTLDLLGVLHANRDDLDEAERYCRQALDVFETAFVADHPDIARCMSNLAAIQQRRGAFADAETTLHEAIRMWRATRGDQHPGLALLLLNLGAAIAAQGRDEEALDVLLHLEELNDLVITRTLPGLSESRCLAWLESIRWSLSVFLSLVAQRLRSPRAIALAADLVLRRKAIVFEILGQQKTLQLKDRAADPVMRQMFELRRRLTEATLADPSVEGLDVHRQRVRSLHAEVEDLESHLARSVPGTGVEQRLRRADHRTIAAALPAESALVELIHFDDVRFDAVAPSVAAKSSRYLAFVLRGGEPDRVEMIDLGDAEGIERQITAFHKWLASCSRSKASGRNGRAVRRTVFDPIVRTLPGCKRLLIAPDGMFHRLPFEALPDEAGGHVLDTYRISYLVAGRDLGEPSAARRAHETTAPLVAGAPDFDFLEAGELPFEWSRDDFEPLSMTATEAEEVAAILNVEPLLGPGVVKKVIEQYRRPFVLHLATHGFFFADPRHRRRKRSPTLSPGRGASPLGLFHAPPEDPMLRSGLALAGANKARRGLPLNPAAGNGLLLGADVLGLDLAGTELVVLSACETGLGDIRNSEGVYGLCRAFLLAGARTLVMSLWQVADLTTSKLMTAYYAALREQDKAEALCSAKKLIRANATTRHPYFWAAFVSIGDSGPLPVGFAERPLSTLAEL